MKIIVPFTTIVAVIMARSVHGFVPCEPEVCEETFKDDPEKHRACFGVCTALCAADCTYPYRRLGAPEEAGANRELASSCEKLFDLFHHTFYCETNSEP